MTTQTKQAPTLSELQRQKEAADQEASKIAAEIAAARARADEADAAIRKIHRNRIEAWAKDVIANDAQARKDATAAITAARQSFHEAVAAGSPEFLRKYLDLVAAQGALIAQNVRLQNARFELGIRGEELPSLGRHGQVATFLDELQGPVARAASAIVGDAEDRAWAEHRSILAGDVEDGGNGS